MPSQTLEITSSLIDAQLLPFSNEQYREGVRFLSFPLTAEVDGLIPLADLQGVIKVAVGDISPVPHVNEFWLGIINSQGEAAWILDLAGLLGMTHWCRRPFVAQRGMAMLVEVNNLTLGLLVEQVKAIKNYPPESCLSISPGMFPPRLRNFLQGYFLDKEARTSILLDVERLTQTLGL
ncbi:MAG: chemotaxis protein CheW [Cyanobacteria bacterium J083]|nr:MAG: chemotaxis protein CheW [Cyanobacteria bacterium J083]